MTRTWRLHAIALLSLLPVMPAVAQNGETTQNKAVRQDRATSATAAREIDPKAEAILRQMSDFLAAQKYLEIKFSDTYDRLNDDGQLIQFAHQRDMSIQRPNRMRYVVHGDETNDEIFYDGKTLTAFKPKEKVYATIKVPDTIDATLAEMRANYRIEYPAANFARSDIADGVLQVAQKLRYIGIHHVGPIECHHLAVIGTEIEGQLWIETGKTPFLRKVVIAYLSRPGEPRYAMTVDSVKILQGFPQDFFTFTPPPGSEKIEFFPVARRKMGDAHEK